jgi:hypothetical protein
MRITVKQTFLHGRDRFEASDMRVVSDEDGAYFVKNGWAAEGSAEAMPASSGEVTLGIQNSKLGVGDSNG